MPPSTAPNRGVARYAPWAALVLGILVFYGIEASLRRTPWLFTDELEWTQLSRAIAATGHAARRTEPHSFESLYSFLIAPAWWIHSTASAYAAVKYINAVVMCLTAVPAYLLARMLVSRGAALAVALLSIAIPAMAYATSIVPESLAYLWFTARRAARRPAARRAERRARGARRFSSPSPGSRCDRSSSRCPRSSSSPPRRSGSSPGQAAGSRGGASRSRSAGWSPSRSSSTCSSCSTSRAGASASTSTTTPCARAASRWARSSIGLGFLPVIGAIASLWLPERAGDPAYRAFAAYLGASIVTLWIYTAAKSTYLVATLHKLIEERNLFYLSPLLLLGTALVLGARKVNWLVVGGASLLVLAVSWSGLLIVGAPYFEAPGLAILTLANREFYWDINDFHLVAIGAVVVAVVLLVLAEAPMGRRRRGASSSGRGCSPGEIYATKTNTNYSRVFASRIPAPRDWVDAATGGSHVTFLGQGLNLDPTPLWLTEFWNRSIDHVAAIDGTAPGPGPASGPGPRERRRRRSRATPATRTRSPGPGVRLAAPIVKQQDGFTLYRTPTRWHLLDERQNVFADGWATSPIELHVLPAGRAGDRRDRPLAHGVHRVRAAGPRHDSRRHRQAGRPGRACPRQGPRRAPRGRAERREANRHACTFRRRP